MTGAAPATGTKSLAYRFACWALLGIAGSAGAMWVALDDEALIRSSDLIVMGEWQGSGGEPGMGIIAVSEVLKGERGPTAVRIALPAAHDPRSSSDPAFRRGERGLWLLRLQPGSRDTYLADHPQRFVPSAGGEIRIRQLRRLLAPP
jgi:hypothetical protein